MKLYPLLFALVLFSLPTRYEKRWETYCYPEPVAEVVTLVEWRGYDIQILQNDDGQPGWWYLRGKPRGSCLLMHYWYTGDVNWPYAEFIKPAMDKCCTSKGF